MKAVILAGGLGTRFSEKTKNIPKPMINIGNMPILWHIMKYYDFYGIRDFIICCGYKSEVIKSFFINYSSRFSNIEIDLNKNNIKLYPNFTEKWKIKLIETGDNSMTGGRLARVKNYLSNDDDFCFTYGDGLTNLDLNKLIKFHKEKKKIATLTAVYSPARYGVLKIDKNNIVKKFDEKKNNNEGLINGGFYVLNKKALNYIKNDRTIWEKEPIQKLTRENQLSAYIHKDFWMPMDTERDYKLLTELWNKKKAPWKLWK
jgi:glucose-1-phosphate cytidylyltransferase